MQVWMLNASGLAATFCLSTCKVGFAFGQPPIKIIINFKNQIDNISKTDVMQLTYWTINLHNNIRQDKIYLYGLWFSAHLNEIIIIIKLGASPALYRDADVLK